MVSNIRPRCTTDRAGDARRAERLHYNAELNKAFDETPTHRFDSTDSRLRTAANNVLKGLLFCEEAKLTDRVVGTTTFARDFARARRSKGRSLREFDLATRLFKYPCSYLIYSEAFDKMPADVRDLVLKRLFAVLTVRTRTRRSRT